MRIRWRGLELPARVVRDDATSTKEYAKFTIEPFERGFGTTVGNSLRRILLSSIEGAAVTYARIAGADHEFTSLPGVLEDVTDIVLNIKGIVLDVDGDEPRKLRLERKQAGPVTAGDFQCDPGVTINDPGHHIATLTDNVPFSIELTAGRGRGYVPASEHISDSMEIGVIPIDSLYSPVTRVRYHTEDTRVGQKTNYDRLVMEVWTKGTVPPEDALVEAAKILRKHLNPFVQYFELGAAAAAGHTARAESSANFDDRMTRVLSSPISELGLSVRASNCLEAAKIMTVGELVQMDEPGLLQLRSFGKTSLDEVKGKLESIGLALGMKFDDGSTATAGV